MHQHCAPLQNPKISSTRNWMLLLATFPKQDNCTYWEMLMQEWEPIMTHGLHVFGTMAWGKLTKMDRDLFSSAAIIDGQSLTHSWRTNHATKCPGDTPGQVIGINLILSLPDVMLLTMFSTHAATTERIATLFTR